MNSFTKRSACSRESLPSLTVEAMTYPLTAAQAHLAELVAEARRSHRPVTISEHGKPVAALINVDDLADLKDRAALAAHLADKAAGRGGVNLEELDAGLDRVDAQTSGEPDRRLPGDGLRQPRPYPWRGQGSVHMDAPCHQRVGQQPCPEGAVAWGAR